MIDKSQAPGVAEQTAARIEALARRLCRGSHPHIDPDTLVMHTTPFRIVTPGGESIIIKPADLIPLWKVYGRLAQIALDNEHPDDQA